MMQGKITEVDIATVQSNLFWRGTGTGICWIAYPVAWKERYGYDRKCKQIAF